MLQTTIKKPQLITPNTLPKNHDFYFFLFCITSCFKTQSILLWYIIQLSLLWNTFNLCSVLFSLQLYFRLYTTLWLIVHTGPVVFFLGVNIIIIQAFKHAYFAYRKLYANWLKFYGAFTLTSPLHNHWYH